MEWHTPMFGVVLEFLNTLLIKVTNICFGHKDKYVINKQFIINVFEVCVDGYVKEPKDRSVSC
jgi:hypothetical protein